jgi:hypothetical protein
MVDLFKMERKSDTPTQARFRALVTAEASVIEIGHRADERVGPTRLGAMMGWRQGHDLNGWAARVRREVLEELGFEKVHDRWVRVKVE